MSSDLLNDSYSNLSSTVQPCVVPNHELECRVFTFITYDIVFGLMCVLGVIGNVLSFIVLHFDKPRSPATFLLQVNCVLDTLFLIATLVATMFTATLLCMGIIPNTHWFNPYLQILVWPIVHITHLCTVYITILIALNRYFAICLPFQSERLVTMAAAKLEVGVMIAAVIVYNIPRFLEFDIPCSDASSASPEDSNVTNGTLPVAEMKSGTACKCLKKWIESDEYRIIYENVLYFLVVFLLPFGLLIFFNISLAVELVKMSKRNMSRTDRRELNLTKVMIVIILTFLVTQTPALINQTLYYFLGEEHYQCGHPYFYYYHLSNVIIASYPASNFIIYCVWRDNFRRRLMSLRCRFFCRIYSVESRDSVTSTSTNARSSNMTEKTHLSPSLTSQLTTTAAAEKQHLKRASDNENLLRTAACGGHVVT